MFGVNLKEVFFFCFWNSTFYRPQRSWGKVMFYKCVCDSVHRGWWVCLSACWDTTPQEQTPSPGADPPEQASPKSKTPKSRHPPKSRHTPPRAHPPRAGTPPRADPPQEQAPPSQRADPPPPEQSMLGDTVNARPVRILLECNLVWNEMA